MTAATNTEAAHVSCNGTNIIFLSIYNTGEKKQGVRVEKL